MFDPRHLRLLQEIARTGSLSAAALELGFSQPAVSYQLRSLEREVGTVLVVRNGRATRLTPAGEALAAHADRILSSIQTAEQNLADIVGSQSGSLRIAAFPSGCATLVPAAMAEMQRVRPSVEVQLRQAEPPAARTMVRRGETDLAVTYRYADPMPQKRAESRREVALQRITLMEDPVRLVLPVDHPLADREEIELCDLADSTWIISSQNFEGILQRAAYVSGFTPSIAMVADDYVAMQALVAHRLGVTVLPRLALFAHLDERVVYRPVREWSARAIEVEVWPDRMRVDAVKAMLRALRAACTAHQEAAVDAVDAIRASGAGARADSADAPRSAPAALSAPAGPDPAPRPAPRPDPAPRPHTARQTGHGAAAAADGATPPVPVAAT